MENKEVNSNKNELISIPNSSIEEMNEDQLFKELSKAEYEEVFTEETWTHLNKQLDKFRNQ